MFWFKLGVAGSWPVEMSGGFSGWAYMTVKGLRALGKGAGDDHSAVCIPLHHVGGRIEELFLSLEILFFVS